LLFPKNLQKNEHCIKVDEKFSQILAKNLGDLNIPHEICTPMTPFFATNLPLMNHISFSKLIQEKYPGAKIQKRHKNPKTGILLIPSKIVSNNNNLQNALNSDDGTPIYVPSCPAIYLRPKKKKKKTPKAKYSNHKSKTKQTSSKSYASIVSSNQNQMPIIGAIKNNEPMKALEARIESLEKSRDIVGKQLSKIESNQTVTNNTLGNLTKSIESLVIAISQNQSNTKKSQRSKRPYSSSPESHEFEYDEDLEPEFSPVNKPIQKKQKINLDKNRSYLENPTSEESLKEKFEKHQLKENNNQRTTTVELSSEDFNHLETVKKMKESINKETIKTKNRMETALAAYGF